MISAAERRLTELPVGRFLSRDWLALLAICLLAVVIRASVMALLPSILHPDERDWLEAADRLVNHQGLLTWDFQVGERSWLWPGLIAGFMAMGQLFGARPDASLGGVAVLMCIISLAPVICGFLWGRNVAGFAGAVTTGLLNAVWFELVYFYSHPLSETAASAALVTGLYLSYPGRNGWSERQMMGRPADARPTPSSARTTSWPSSIGRRSNQVPVAQNIGDVEMRRINQAPAIEVTSSQAWNRRASLTPNAMVAAAGKRI